MPELPRDLRDSGIQSWQRYSETHRRGSVRRAPVTVVVFSDYACPHCRSTFEALADLQERYPQDLEVISRPFPRSGAPSYEAAAAAECARGFGRFAAMHALLFERAADLPVTAWEEIAEAAGIRDLPRFAECFRGDSVRATIAESVGHGRELGARITPTILMNNVLLHGNPGRRHLEAIVRELLRGEDGR